MLVALVSGVVFALRISGGALYVERVFDGLDPTVERGWIEQAFEWLVVQNGKDRPVIWDGRGQAFQSDPENGEMPVGSMMKFIHHRIAVVSADNRDKVAVSDLWRNTETENVWKFNETPTWADAGVFGLHANFGPLMAIDSTQQIRRTPDGQGFLLLMGRNGFQTLNLLQRREDWLNSQLQDTALEGEGLHSYRGVTKMKQSIWYLGEYGLREFRRAQGEAQRSDTDSDLSADVRPLFQASDSNLRHDIPMWNHDGRVYVGLLPREVRSEFGGRHYFCDTWSSLDVTTRFSAGRQLPDAWDGSQSGIRPSQAVSVDVAYSRRTYVWSYDEDGKNRVYEMVPYRDDSVDGRSKKVSWHVELGPFNADARSKAAASDKTPAAVRVDYSEAQGEVSAKAKYRTKESSGLKDWGSLGEQGEPSSGVPGANTHCGTMGATEPKDVACTPGDSVTEIYLRLECEGGFKIDEVKMLMDAEEKSGDSQAWEVFSEAAAGGSSQKQEPEFGGLYSAATK